MEIDPWSPSIYVILGGEGDQAANVIEKKVKKGDRSWIDFGIRLRMLKLRREINRDDKSTAEILVEVDRFCSELREMSQKSLKGEMMSLKLQICENLLLKVKSSEFSDNVNAFLRQKLINAALRLEEAKTLLSKLVKGSHLNEHPPRLQSNQSHLTFIPRDHCSPHDPKESSITEQEREWIKLVTGLQSPLAVSSGNIDKMNAVMSHKSSNQQDCVRPAAKRFKPDPNALNPHMPSRVTTNVRLESRIPSFQTEPEDFVSKIMINSELKKYFGILQSEADLGLREKEGPSQKDKLQADIILELSVSKIDSCRS